MAGIFYAGLQLIARMAFASVQGQRPRLVYATL
jgi:hypothetical protein